MVPGVSRVQFEPFQVHVVVVGRDAAAGAAARSIYEACWSAGLDALLDDRDERPGVKFKDADLLGIPMRITVGNLLAKEGLVELKIRKTREEQKVRPAEVVATIESLRSSG